MNTKLIVGLLVVIAGFGLGWYVLKGSYQEPAPITTEKATTPSPPAAPAAKVTVIYTDSGYILNTIRVTKGTTVTWVNQSGGGMWTASDVHPTHQLLPGFDQLKSVSRGGSYDYTFTKVGTWKYHNHVNASDTGTVVVTE